MRAAAVGVVDEEDVAGVDVVTELLHDGLALEMQGADVNGDVSTALHDGVSVAVTES